MLRSDHCYEKIVIQTDIRHQQESGQTWELDLGEEMVAYMCPTSGGIRPQCGRKYKPVARL
jgi:hypothetical protein